MKQISAFDFYVYVERYYTEIESYTLYILKPNCEFNYLGKYIIVTAEISNLWYIERKYYMIDSDEELTFFRLKQDYYE